MSQSNQDISAHTPGPWRIFRVGAGDNEGNLLGVGGSDGESILDRYGCLWGSGAERMANALIADRFENEYEAVIRAQTPEERRIADDAFLTKVNAYLAIKDAEREATPVDPAAALRAVMAASPPSQASLIHLPDVDMPIDAGIAYAVAVLHSNGIQTIQSCEGGIGHPSPEPMIWFTGTAWEGFRAVAIAKEHGLPVDEIRWVYPVRGDHIEGPRWVMTFRTKVPFPDQLSRAQCAQSGRPAEPERR